MGKIGLDWIDPMQSRIKIILDMCLDLDANLLHSYFRIGITMGLLVAAGTQSGLNLSAKRLDRNFLSYGGLQLRGGGFLRPGEGHGAGAALQTTA